MLTGPRGISAAVSLCCLGSFCLFFPPRIILCPCSFPLFRLPLVHYYPFPLPFAILATRPPPRQLDRNPAAIQLPKPTILDWLDCKEEDQLLSDCVARRIQAGSAFVRGVGSSDFTPSALSGSTNGRVEEGDSHDARNTRSRAAGQAGRIGVRIRAHACRLRWRGEPDVPAQVRAAVVFAFSAPASDHASDPSHIPGVWVEAIIWGSTRCFGLGFGPSDACSQL